MKHRRGCKKPGMDYEQRGPVFVYTSPYLLNSKKEPLRVYECPVGKVLRESPGMYDLIPQLGLVENATPTEWAAMPRFVQRLASLYSSEKARLMDLKRNQNSGWNDANYGAAVRARYG